jgi:hypothetical protein
MFYFLLNVSLKNGACGLWRIVWYLDKYSKENSHILFTVMHDSE